MKKILFIFFLIFTNTAFAEEEILLTCTVTKSNKYYFVINKTKLTSKFMNVSKDVLNGKLSINENTYILHFPKTRKRYETIVIINRYSGKMNYEFGDPPFGEFNLNNVVNQGNCSIDPNVRKF